MLYSRSLVLIPLARLKLHDLCLATPHFSFPQTLATTIPLFDSMKLTIVDTHINRIRQFMPP